MSLKRLEPLASRSAPVFAALGDARRLRIVARLSSGASVSITDLASRENVSRQAVTKHLQVLADAGLVRASRHGREQIYALNPKHLEPAARYLELLTQHWDEALDRLKILSEED